MKLRLNYFAAAAALAILTACTQAPPPPPDTREADAKAIRDAGTKQLADIKKKDVDAITSFWADDAHVFFPNMALLSGNAAIKDMIKGMVNDPGFTLDFADTKVEVAKSSDIGYEEGTYTMTTTDPKTKKILTEKGKFVTVFKKQPDGAWKAVADINNADAPAAIAK
jgi:ketosteroid isomerase-like protein